MNIPYVMKKCNKCGRWLVASKANFYGDKTKKYGLESQCKECKSKMRKLINKPVNTDPNITKVCTVCGREFPATTKYFNRLKNGKYGLMSVCKECKNMRKKQWDENNKEKVVERKKRYNQSPKGQVVLFNGNYRRRVKEEQRGTGITKDQWLEMMKYFDWRCAYSGGALTKNNRSIDHIVPLNSGGDNMIWNCVPMTRSLNCSKQDKDMLEWYKEQSFYSEARLAKIYEWQEYARKKWKK